MLDGLNITQLSAYTRFNPARYKLDVRARVAGKCIRKREIFEGTLKQARERYFDLLSALRTDIPTPVKTFGELLDKYADHRGGEVPLKQSTIYHALKGDLGNVPLKDLPDVLDRYAITLRKTVSPRTGRRLANGTINRYRAMIYTTLNLAVEWNILDKNPLNRRIFPKQKEVPRDRVLSPEEVLRLFNVLEKNAPFLCPVINFAIQMPVRTSELKNMKKEDLDLINNVIRIHNGTTKNDEGGWKLIPPNMVDYFRTLPPECPYLFYRLRSGVFKPLGEFRNVWVRCLLMAGITNFRFHDLRHMAVTGLADAGTPEQAIMSAAGWKTNMMAIYYHHSKKKSLGLIRFPDGKSSPRVHTGYTLREETEKSVDFRVEKAGS